MSKRRLFLIATTLAGTLLAGCFTVTNSVRYENDRAENDRPLPALRFSDVGSETHAADRGGHATLTDDESDYVSSFLDRYVSNETKLNADRGDKRERVIMQIIKYLDTPYKYGGTTMNGIDCSAFTQSVFNTALDYSLLRSAKMQYSQGEVVPNPNRLEFGDLVFFNTRRAVRPGHVGIYIGDNMFAHASSSKGVTVSSLESSYYKRTYMGARRMLTF
jgi:cell wall-associated NlpC family hydrolase